MKTGLYFSIDFGEFWISSLLNKILSLPVTFYWKHCCPTHSGRSSRSL